MRSFGATVKMFRPPVTAPEIAAARRQRRGHGSIGDSAMAVLFPELASDRRQPRAALAPGLLRAPPRWRSPPTAPPCLGALVLETVGAGLPPGIATPDGILD